MTGRRRLIVRLLPVVAAIAATVPAAIAVSGAPASGDRLLPDLVQETPTQLVLTKARAHGRASWRLGFRSAVSNVGSGPLIIEGARPSVGRQAMTAAQVVTRSSGPKEVVDRAGSLRYVRSPDHQHWHLLGFDRYELRRAGSSRAVVRDRKSGFCLGDRYSVTTPALPARPPEPVYTSRCGLERPALLGIREGISVGYGDNYNANLEGQYLPLDRLRPGRYVLVHRVNADRRLVEASYDNNASSVRLRLRLRRGVPELTILAVCPASARCAGAH
jgi:Lysyl oxidase